MRKITSLFFILWQSIALSGTLNFGAQALYLQPEIDAANFRGTRTLSNGNIEYVNYNPQYAWGFEVEGAYQFNPTYDINLSFYHVDKTNKRTFGPITGNEGDLLSAASGTIQPSWNAVNLELGQRIDFKPTIIHLHAGIQYAHIALDETASVVVNINNTFFPDTKTIKRTYNGFGPRFGALLIYAWQNGLGIDGHVATTLLAGTRTSNTTYQGTLPISNRFASATTIVPELEAKLGAHYNRTTKQANLTFEAGWMWLNYFQAIFNENYNLSANRPMEHTSSSFGLQGPFFGMTWHGN